MQLKDKVVYYNISVSQLTLLIIKSLIWKTRDFQLWKWWLPYQNKKIGSCNINMQQQVTMYDKFMLEIDEISLPFSIGAYMLRFLLLPLPRRLLLAIFNFFLDFFPIPPTGFKEAMLWLPSAISKSGNFKSKYRALDCAWKATKCQ